MYCNNCHKSPEWVGKKSNGDLFCMDCGESMCSVSYEYKGEPVVKQKHYCPYCGSDAVSSMMIPTFGNPVYTYKCRKCGETF